MPTEPKHSPLWSGEGLRVIEWCAWDNFLVSHLLPNSERVSIDPFSYSDESASRTGIEKCLGLVFQINLAQTDQVPPYKGALQRDAKDADVFVINSEFCDLRKRTLQGILGSIGLPTTQAKQNGSADEVLIVKTNLNHGGIHEKHLKPDLLTAFGMDLPSATKIDARTYFLTTRANMEPDLWNDPSILVEHYIANTKDSFHRAYVCGNHIVITQAFAEGHIKKIQGDTRDINYFFFRNELLSASEDDYEGLTPFDVVKQLAVFLDHVMLDYGAIDLVNDEERAYIVDVNTTPYAGSAVPNAEATEFLRLGILSAFHGKL